jgi:Xaa-Pro aminopeptidase
MNGAGKISQAPYERKLIDERLLANEELQWVNDYHAEVRKNVEPLLRAQVLTVT